MAAPAPALRERPRARLARLGTYTTGRGCLYLKRVDDVDPAVLEEILTRSVANARAAGG